MSYYKANDKYSATLSSGYTVDDTTLYVTAVPTNVPTIVVAAKGTDNETVFAVTGKTTNSLTGVSRLRGADVDLDTATPLTCLNNEEFINQYEDAAATPATLKNLIYAADGGSSDTYAITMDPAPTAYVEGMLVSFKANTVNTGAASLNVNSLGAKTIKKFGDQDLSSNDIKASQIVTVVYDGTSFQLQGPVRQTKIVGIQVVDAATDTATGDGKAFYEIPEELNGMNLTACGATVYTAGTTNTTDIQLRNATDSVDMLSTKITIDTGEVSSRTAAAASVIDTSKDDVVTGDRIAADVDAIHTTPAKGLYIWMRFELP